MLRLSEPLRPAAAEHGVMRLPTLILILFLPAVSQARCVPRPCWRVEFTAATCSASNVATRDGVWLTLEGKTHAAEPIACAPGLGVMSPGRFEESFQARTQFHYKATALSACSSLVAHRRVFFATHTCSEGNPQSEYHHLRAPVLSELPEAPR